MTAKMSKLRKKNSNPFLSNFVIFFIRNFRLFELFDAKKSQGNFGITCDWLKTSGVPWV